MEAEMNEALRLIFLMTSPKSAVERFHLPGQHDQQSHAGGRGGHVETIDLGLREYKADLVAEGAKHGVPVEFGDLGVRQLGSKTANCVGQFDPKTGVITMDLRSMFMLPAREIFEVLKHEISHARLHDAWTNGKDVHRFINDHVEELTKAGKKVPSDYAKAWWRRVARTEFDTPKWADTISTAIMESEAELIAKFHGDIPDQFAIYRQLSKLVDDYHATKSHRR